MAINRPNLPYNGVARQNDSYFKLLTQDRGGVPYEALDGYFNFFTDQCNDIITTMNGISLGDLPGVSDPTNANKLLTTNGAGSASWVFVQASNILDQSINGGKLFPQTITATQLANGAVGANQLAQNAVTTIKILDANVTLEKMADDSVGTDQIIDDNVTLDKMADDSVGTDQIIDDSVGTDQIIDDAITTAKILNANVTTTKILDGNITTSKIAANAVTAAKIADNTITATQVDPAFLAGGASKAQQIAATSTTVFTNPNVQQHHPSAAKFTCNFDGTLAGTNAPREGYNVASVTMNSAGYYTINFTVPFATANYCVCITTGVGGNPLIPIIFSQSTGSINIGIRSPDAAPTSPLIVCVVGFGTQ